MSSSLSLDDILSGIKATKKRFPPSPPKPPAPPPPPPVVVRRPHEPLQKLFSELIALAEKRARKRKRRKRKFEHHRTFVPLMRRRRYRGDVSYYKK